jgi:CheY-like chemotaxis protein
VTSGVDKSVPDACVLIVDDDPANREVLTVILTHEGLLTETAACGAEALARVAQKAPSLILLDVMMPDMSGYDVALRLKADPATKHIPIIMMTALNDRATKMRALSTGAESFLSKPMNRVVLCAHVRSFLGCTLPPH